MTLRSLVRAYVQADKYVTHSGVADYSSGEANVKPRRKVSGPTVTSIQEAPLLRVKYANV